MDIVALLILIFASTWFKVIAGLIGLNVVVGIAVALYTATFNFTRLSEFLTTRALPYLLVDAGLQVFLKLGIDSDPTLAAGGLGSDVGVLIHAFVVATLIAHVLGDLRSLGLPMPGVIAGPAPVDKPIPPALR